MLKTDKVVNLETADNVYIQHMAFIINRASEKRKNDFAIAQSRDVLRTRPRWWLRLE